MSRDTHIRRPAKPAKRILPGPKPLTRAARVELLAKFALGELVEKHDPKGLHAPLKPRR